MEAQVGTLRSAGFVVVPACANVGHFDVQLLSGHADVAEDPPQQFGRQLPAWSPPPGNCGRIRLTLKDNNSYPTDSDYQQDTD